MYFVKRVNNPTFILELKLSTVLWQQHILDKRFELARKLYNTTLSYALKQVQLMRESKRYRQQVHGYREVKSKISKTTNEKRLKACQAELNAYRKQLEEIRKTFGLTEFSLHDYIKKYQKNIKKHIDSHTAQKVASKVWTAMKKVIFEGKKAHFKKYGTVHTVENKTNRSGILFRDNQIHWTGLKMPVTIRKNDLFAQEVLSSHRVKYCRLVRKVIGGKDAYYVQLVMDGIPPAKRINTTGSFRHPETPAGRVGIDIGTSTVAVSSNKEVFIQPLAPKLPQLDQEKKRLLRKLDRSRRSTNPHHFHADGTIKKGIKLTWTRSHQYMKTLYQVRELYRKRSAYVKEQHAQIANRILSCGNEVYVETMNFQALAKRAKETKVNPKGKCQRKKRFGKSVGSYAPALLIRMIHQKLGYLNSEIHKVNTRTFKASQYNHVTDTYKKKKLSQRWTAIDTRNVQRDLYSAFLLMNSQIDLRHPNRELCHQTFEQFVKLHNEHMKELRQTKDSLPCSIGIKKAS